MIYKTYKTLEYVGKFYAALNFRVSLAASIKAKIKHTRKKKTFTVICQFLKDVIVQYTKLNVLKQSPWL